MHVVAICCGCFVQVCAEVQGVEDRVERIHEGVLSEERDARQCAAAGRLQRTHSGTSQFFNLLHH